MRAHQVALSRHAERLCRSHADACDLVQDTFERALRAWDRLPGDANVGGWLVTILGNLFLDRCRRARTMPRLYVAWPAGELDVPAPETAAPRPWAEITEDQVRAAVSALESDFRLPYELHALEGRSYREIADELGIPTSTVGTRLSRARAKLRRALLHHVGPRPSPSCSAG